MCRWSTGRTMGTGRVTLTTKRCELPDEVRHLDGFSRLLVSTRCPARRGFFCHDDSQKSSPACCGIENRPVKQRTLCRAGSQRSGASAAGDCRSRAWRELDGGAAKPRCQRGAWKRFTHFRHGATLHPVQHGIDKDSVVISPRVASADDPHRRSLRRGQEHGGAVQMIEISQGIGPPGRRCALWESMGALQGQPLKQRRLG